MRGRRRRGWPVILVLGISGVAMIVVGLVGMLWSVALAGLALAGGYALAVALAQKGHWYG